MNVLNTEDLKSGVIEKFVLVYCQLSTEDLTADEDVVTDLQEIDVAIAKKCSDKNLSKSEMRLVEPEDGFDNEFSGSADSYTIVDRVSLDGDVSATFPMWAIGIPADFEKDFLPHIIGGSQLSLWDISKKYDSIFAVNAILVDMHGDTAFETCWEDGEITEGFGDDPDDEDFHYSASVIRNFICDAF